HGGARRCSALRPRSLQPPGSGGSVVVALRSPHRRCRRTLSGVCGASGCHGPDGLVCRAGCYRHRHAGADLEGALLADALAGTGRRHAGGYSLGADLEKSRSTRARQVLALRAGSREPCAPRPQSAGPGPALSRRHHRLRGPPLPPWLAAPRLASGACGPVARGGAMNVSVAQTTKQELLGIPIDALTMRETLDRVHQTIVTRGRLRIGVVNAAKLANMRDNPALRADVLCCDLVLADGVSVVWASRLL